LSSAQSPPAANDDDDGDRALDADRIDVEEMRGGAYYGVKEGYLVSSR
jgi:hypothetical protein